MMQLDELLSRIADYTNDAIMVTEAGDLNAPGPRIVYVNPSFTKLTGYEPTEVIGKTPRVLQGPKTDRATLDRIRKAVEKKQAIEVELINYSKKKHAYWVEISISPVFDADGNCSHYVSIEKDITDRKVMQEATEQQSMEFLFSEARTRAILYSIVDGIITFETDGTIERFSPSAEQIFGLEADDVEGQHLGLLFASENADEYLKWFNDFAQQTHQGGAYQKREIIGKRQSGETFLAELSLSKIISGNKTLLVAAVRDVTELRKAEEEARNQNRLVKLLQRVASMANAADSIQECFAHSMELICEHFNLCLAHAYLFDAPRDVLVSTGLWYQQDDGRYSNFMQSSHLSEFAAGTDMVGKALMMNKPVLLTSLDGETPFLRAGEALSAGITGAYAFPVEIGSEVVAVLEFFSESAWCPSEDELSLMQNIGNQIGRVIERKRNESAIIAARDAAEASTRAKSEFLANMSHELRTPMNGILGLAELLMDSSLDAVQRESLSALQGSASSLLVILNDILDFSKIEAGELKLECQPFLLKGFLQYLEDLFAPMASKKGLGFSIHAEAGLAEAYAGDESRLKQVLINLLGNAVKFTQNGQVRLEISQAALTTEKHLLQIRVVDTGIGIPEHSLSSIFNKFTQADNSNTRQYGGTGLGLAISKQLVEMMGGSIGVESAIGQGSTFWFHIPIEMANPADVAQPKAAALMNAVSAIDAEKAKLLVVEDHPVNSMVLRQLLAKLGITKFDVAENGAEAVEAVQAHQYDLILMDCQMPQMDGYEATHRIRELEMACGQRTPIIAMTANAMVGDRERCLREGMDDYVSKPIDSQALVQTIGRWLRIQSDNSAALMKASAPAQLEKDLPIDMAHLRVFTGGDLEEERILFEVFLESAEDSIAQLAKHATQMEGDEWRRAAHRIKGAAGNLGAHDLHQACLMAEKAHTESEQERRALLSEIEQELERVRRFIAQQRKQQAA